MTSNCSRCDPICTHLYIYQTIYPQAAHTPPHTYANTHTPDAHAHPYQFTACTILTLHTQRVAALGPRYWSEIAAQLPGTRLGKQARDRWHNHLCPSVCKEGWTEEEETLIMQLVRLYTPPQSDIVSPVYLAPIPHLQYTQLKYLYLTHTKYTNTKQQLHLYTSI
jgi:hypothetical protein